MTTRAEEIAAKEYPDTPSNNPSLSTSEPERAAFVNGYKQGQQDRWISVKDRLPEKRERDYRVLAMSHKRYPPDCNYPNELKPGVYQDWVIRQWPDNFTWWSDVSFDVLPSPPNPNSDEDRRHHTVHC